MQYTRKEKHFHFIPGFRISLPTPRFPKNQQRYSKNKISRKMTITRRTPSQTTLFLEGSPPLPRERATSPLPDSLQPALRAARTLPIPMQNTGTWFSDALPTNAHLTIPQVKRTEADNTAFSVVCAVQSKCRNGQRASILFLGISRVAKSAGCISISFMNGIASSTEWMPLAVRRQSAR